jgi:signal transduction histidine kinase
MENPLPVPAASPLSPTPQTTILVVDDSYADISTLVETFKNEAYRVLVARDGASALEKVRFGQPDLVLMDVRMPDIDGFEACRMIKAESPDLPVIFVTALNHIVDKVKGFQAGGVDYLVKPYQTEEVLARIRVHLELRRTRLLLEAQNQKLVAEITRRQQAEYELQHVNARLELLVKERTSQLARANLSLSEEIQERKCAEEELQKLYNELEARVHDRTVQLEAANQELEAFSYSVSHDLRAPLRALDGFSQALTEEYFDKLEGDGQDYLQHIRQAALRMQTLIDDLLRLSRLTSGGIHRTPIDLSQLACESFQSLEKNYPYRDIIFRVAPDLQVYADANLMRVVLENLLSNALKFTSKHPSAMIEVGSLDGSDGPVYYVHDDGAGFDMKYADRLFGTFQRLHNANEFEGTGVGLSIVQRIIHRHGGRVWAESAVEQGATFYFTLPS